MNQLTNALKQSNHHLDNGSKGDATRFIENYLSHLQRKANDHHVTSEAKEKLTKLADVIIEKW